MTVRRRREHGEQTVGGFSHLPLCELGTEAWGIGTATQILVRLTLLTGNSASRCRVLVHKVNHPVKINWIDGDHHSASVTLRATPARYPPFAAAVLVAVDLPSLTAG